MEICKRLGDEWKKEAEKENDSKKHGYAATAYRSARLIKQGKVR